jgi:magnesium-transporting ATPase (P-type)
MGISELIPAIANVLVIVALVLYSFGLFGEYHSRGRWAKNITTLVASIGTMVLAIALLLTPFTARVMLQVAQSGISDVLIWVSSGLLLAAIASFGAITFWRPLRLWHERRIARHLSRELPRVD